MDFSPKKIFLGLVALIILFVILLVVGIIPGLRPPSILKTELDFWGLERDETALKSVIATYQNSNPSILIKYTGFDEDEYEKRLIDGLAAGSGPDIFMFHNNWLLKHKNKIFAAPERLITQSVITELFPQIVSQDFISGGQIFALPMQIDTLALIYNRSTFDNKQIPVAISDWDEIQKMIPKLREVSGGKLIKAALAIGGSDRSVYNATDILSLLMFQFKTQMTSADGTRATFAGGGAGLQALNFYTSFTDPKNNNYTWDEGLGGSIDSFIDSKTAMILAYNADLKEIRARNPVLNFGILPFPQFNKDEAINLPDYWGLAVSNKTSEYLSSWNFIVSAATDINLARTYANISGESPALRSLISDYLTNPNLKVFAAQSLTARNWTHPDPIGVREVFNNMISSVLINRSGAPQFIAQAQDEITKLLQRR